MPDAAGVEKPPFAGCARLPVHPGNWICGVRFWHPDGLS